MDREVGGLQHGVAKMWDTTEQLSVNMKERKGVSHIEILN